MTHIETQFIDNVRYESEQVTEPTPDKGQKMIDYVRRLLEAAEQYREWDDRDAAPLRRALEGMVAIQKGFKP